MDHANAFISVTLFILLQILKPEGCILSEVVAIQISARDDRPENIEGREKAKLSIKTGDFTKTIDIIRVEKALRQLGIKGIMKYKPDIYSDFGIYVGNRYKIIPSLFVSDENYVGPVEKERASTANKQKPKEKIEN